MARRRIIPSNDPKMPAIRKRVAVTWIKTIIGYLGLGALCMAAMWVCNVPYTYNYGFGFLWLLLPVPMWWYSAQIAILMTKSTPADPNNPDHKRVMDCIDRVYEKSGLKYKPPVYCSANRLPNAFATGPIHRRAVVAFTEGLLDCGMTDDEIEAVFAHELGHVGNYDVAVNSFAAVGSMYFFLILNLVITGYLATIAFFKGVFGIRASKRRSYWPAVLASNILLYITFWLAAQFTNIIQFFVVRSRESLADATASMTTGRPCDLATALQKLVNYVQQNPPKGKEKELWRVLRPIMIIDPIFDTLVPEREESGVWGAIKRFWKNIRLTHPPVPERIAELERINGGKCPLPAYETEPMLEVGEAVDSEVKDSEQVPKPESEEK